MKKQLIFVLLLMLTLGCKKTDHNDPTPPPPDPPPNLFVDMKVTASVQGRVVDQDQKPVSGASVKSGTNTTTTDANGKFVFNNIQMGSTAGSVSVEKEGFFKATRTMMVVAAGMNYAEMQLIPKTEKGNFPAGDGGTVNVQAGSSIQFSASSMINTATNVTYSGIVHVKAAYLDPTDPELSAIMPGNLTGLDSGNQIKLLQTYGMIAVELEGAAGEKLNLANGKTATLKFPIPPTMQAGAPAAMPLWFFNDTTGLWKEQGLLTKEGNFYTGTVTHFSFWNADVPGNFVKLKMKLVDQQGHPLPFYKVKFTQVTNGAVCFARTDTGGVVTGPVPINTVLTWEVFSFCGNIISTSQIGPYSADTDLGSVTVNTEAPSSVTISGTAVNCDGMPVASGYADIFLDNTYFRGLITNGNFSVTLNRCDTSAQTAQITVLDLSTQRFSAPRFVTVRSEDVTLENLGACDVEVDQYVRYTIDDSIKLEFVAPADSFHVWACGDGCFAGTNTFRTWRRSNQKINGVVRFWGPREPGVYNMQILSVNTGNLSLIMTSDSAKAVVTEFSTPGGYITGTVNAKLRDSVGDGNKTYNVKVAFRAKRTPI